MTDKKEFLLQKMEACIGDIEGVANRLLELQVPFKYECDTLVINRSADFELFYYVSYHNETKQIIFMDGEYNAVPIRTVAQFFQSQKPPA